MSRVYIFIMFHPEIIWNGFGETGKGNTASRSMTNTESVFVLMETGFRN